MCLKQGGIKLDYKSTLNLPNTEFPMKANLPHREPEILKKWNDEDIYSLVQEKNKGQKKYILHDGPPYANGPIHLGQALNKILKDIIVKYKSVTGHYAPYVPGWDTHGLPIEIVAIKNFKINRREIDAVELRKKCHELASHYLQVQKDQFKRLGIRGDWDNPYLTYDHTYEATVIKIFRELYEKGFAYRSLKPVYWCWECETALAEAEIEYKDKVSPSIFVRFLVKSDLTDVFPEWRGRTYAVIWTTTPWTLPGNMAIAFNPDFDYALVKADENTAYIVAENLLEKVVKQINLNEYKIIGRVKGSKLGNNYSAYHPFLDRESLFILEDYVTSEDGSGCVHTAPGFGHDDFQAGIKYDLPIIVPCDYQGKLTKDAGIFEGQFHLTANKNITEHLKNTGYLLSETEITHSYPHCWRCKKPIIFRATEQWFIAIDVNNLRENAKKAVEKKIKWVPQWGKDRMYNMISTRPDWCISRQRSWGVPIPAFFCKKCNSLEINSEILLRVEQLFAKKGSDSWYEMSSKEILPENYSCSNCAGNDFEKDMNIFDVWFESGVSSFAVCDNRKELSWPSDLYLEGSDQHRGWFQVSLIPAIALRQTPPYNTDLTHGWILDSKGISMHKSLGNAIDPVDIVNKYGSDVLRLFFASVDYTSDMKIGDDALNQVSENYKKIRNTCRFMLGNLYDFDPEKESVKDEDILSLDRFILNELYHLAEKVNKAFD